MPLSWKKDRPSDPKRPPSSGYQGSDSANGRTPVVDEMTRQAHRSWFNKKVGGRVMSAADLARATPPKREKTDPFKGKSKILPGVAKKMATGKYQPKDPVASLVDKMSYDAAMNDPDFMINPTMFGESQAAKAAADPAALAAQKAALDKMLGLAEGGGWTAEEKARRLQQRADSDQWLRAQREADMANLAERGMLGSGAELAALASDRQAAASRNSLQDARAAADYERRALDAMMGAGELGGTMARDSFNRAHTVGTAADSARVYDVTMQNQADINNIEHKRGVARDWRDKTYEWEREGRSLGVQSALGMLGGAEQETANAARTVGGWAQDDADAFNRGSKDFRDTTIQGVAGTAGTVTDAANKSDKEQREGIKEWTDGWGSAVSDIAGMAGGGATGVAAGSVAGEDEEEDEKKGGW